MEIYVEWTEGLLEDGGVCRLDVFSTTNTFPFKRLQLNRVEQVLTGHCNLQRHKKTTGRAESFLCSKCSLEYETPNHHVGICKHYQDIRVKCFGITETTVHNVVTKCNINNLATYGSRKAFWVRLVTKQNNNNIATTVAMGPDEVCAMCRWTLPNSSRSACTAAHY